MADFKHKSTDSLFMSGDDLALMQKYTEAYNNATDDAGRNAAHDAAEQLRAKYGYSGGADGSGYIKTGQVLGATGETYGGNGGGYQYDADGSIAALREKIMNRAPFSYDALSDPMYQQYRKQYTREAGRSAEDVLGKAAALTGGMPSTAAITASQQASDYQMAQMNDKIPELQQLAYSMYLKDLDADYDALGMLTDAENAAYNRYLAQRDYEYGLSRDAVADQRYAEETAYARQRDAIEDARYADELAYERQMAAQKLAQQGSRSGGGVPLEDEVEPQGMDYDGLFQEAYASGHPESFLSQKENREKYGFSSSTGLYEDYKKWLKDGALDKYDSLKERIGQLASVGNKETIQSMINRYWDQLNSFQQYDLSSYLGELGL